ncbi:MAG: hypothetical protein IJB86_03085 [Clostridia bacterium]|nr:hypothetical protein [Clostridia bacterium]
MSNIGAWITQKITALVLVIIAVINCITGGNVMTQSVAKVNGSLGCTDALGRSVISSSGESDKKVGVFYFLWMGQHDKGFLCDNTKLLKEHPQAVQSEEAWMAAGGGNVGQFHFWGEPLFGYYTADDAWVIGRHVQMLTDASVDFIVVDTTNAVTYTDAAKVMIGVFYDYYKRGYNVPKIAFYTNSASGKTMNRLYDELYNNAELLEKYPDLSDLWFYMDTKPMIIGDKSDKNLRSDVRDFFRIKASQWPNEGKKADGFPWMEFDRVLTYRSLFSYGGTKIMNVSAAQHADTGAFSRTAWYGKNDRTRSWHNGKNDTSDGAVLHGYNFAEQWEFAIKMDPDIIFVTGFNEWVAQRQIAIEEAPVLFVDCVTENCSRDVEPSAGQLGDNYYLQMVDYIAKFKKSVSTVDRGNGVTIDIDGSFDQWNNADISAVYKDYDGETADRDSVGFGNIHYTDNSGRNDIVNMKVTEDGDNYYFYVDTKEKLSPSDGKSFMTLFIDEKIAINRTVSEGGKADVEAITDSGYEKIGEAKVRIEDNRLMLSVSKSLIANDGTILFKWADNYDENDIYSFYTKGDSAPYGRLCYRY